MSSLRVHIDRTLAPADEAETPDATALEPAAAV